MIERWVALSKNMVSTNEFKLIEFSINYLEL